MSDFDHDNSLDEAEAYAASRDVPMELLNEELVRKLLRNAFQAGMNAGMDRAIKQVKEHYDGN